MRLALLHGPSKSASRLKLTLLKQKFDPNQIIVLGSCSLSEIKEVLMSPPLLAQSRLVILENVDEGLNFPDNQSFDKDLTLVLWFDHEVSEKKAVLGWVKKIGGTVLYFAEEQEALIFTFLDLLATQNKKAFLELERLKASSGLDIYYFITMVFYLLRNLIATPKNAKEFMKKKLDRQRANFSPQRLEDLFKNTLEIDFKIKSGLLSDDQAEFLLIQQFLS